MLKVVFEMVKIVTADVGGTMAESKSQITDHLLVDMEQSFRMGEWQRRQSTALLEHLSLAWRAEDVMLTSCY